MQGDFRVYLDRMKNEQPKTLYHYTSPAALFSIIQNRTIRLSARWHLNDPREGADFGDLLAECAPNENYCEEKAKAALKALDNLHFYVACFSRRGDLLSQWRAYAQDGEGVSIGFDRNNLFSCLAAQSEMVVRPVEYADTLEDLDPNGEACRAFSTIMTHGPSPSDGMLQTLAKVRWAIKRKAYREEEECRLIFTSSNPSSISPSLGRTTVKRQFFAAKSELRDCVEVKFDAGDWGAIISEVFIGPRSRTNPAVLENFLAANGLSSTKVIVSEAHYR